MTLELLPEDRPCVALGAPAPVLESPALAQGPEEAYELKFRLLEADGAAVEAWAREHLRPDPHGEGGTYRTTSLYCDTPGLDVYHKSPGYRRSKYRLRRYGTGSVIFLERKKKRGDVVQKRRVAVAGADLALLAGEEDVPGWAGQWFLQRIRFRELRPSCHLAYTRTAFVGSSLDGPIRLTLDRDVVGAPAHGWEVPSHLAGRRVLQGEVILELKFRSSVPALFRDLLSMLPPRLGGASKYRLCVEAWGLAGGAR